MIGSLITLLVGCSGSFVAGVEIGRRHPEDAWQYIGTAVSKAGQGLRKAFQAEQPAEPAPEPVAPVEPASEAPPVGTPPTSAAPA